MWTPLREGGLRRARHNSRRHGGAPDDIGIAAPPERVFALWMDLDRMTEWVGGVTRVTDVSGQIDVAGTRYAVWFGPMRSATELFTSHVVGEGAPDGFYERLGFVPTGTFDPQGERILRLDASA